MPRVRRSVWRRALDKVAPLRKWIYWAICGAHRGPKRIVFVCGAAKSGKTLLCSVLDRDLRVTVFREESAISGRDGNRLRLKPTAEMAAVFERCPTPIIAAEAKVDSQHAASLLQAFPGSTVVWVWRHFEGAVAADLQRFSSQRETLLAVVRGDPGNWRSESVSAETREIVRARYSEDLPRADVAALFWYVRNTLWFDQALDRSSSALLVQYEEFCRSPDLVLHRIYDRIGLPPPGLHASRFINTSFLASERLSLQPETRRLCSELAGRLEAGASTLS
jgi:hypothetical protein